MKTLGLVRRNALDQEHKLAQSFTNRVNRIMKKHSGFGVKTFQLETCGDDFTPSDLDRWLQIAVTPGIEEVKISHTVPFGYYNFPCSLLFNGSGNSIQQLCLIRCAFHPMAGLACLRRLRLCYVHITGDELGCLLSNSFAMEELVLNGCSKITSLKIPCMLQKLNYLQVFGCKALKVVENKAPNLCSVCIDGALVQFPPGDLFQVKDLVVSLDIYKSNLVHYARTRLPSSMLNLETLKLSSAGEMFNTPTIPVKFLKLKNLDISLNGGENRGFSPAYDYCSLVSFLDGCPVLETFKLRVSQTRVKHELISEDSDLRHLPGHRHGNIKNVKIVGFCSAKSMVELTCHILENATSLECLTLDPVNDNGCEDAVRSCVQKPFGCQPVLGRHMITQAHRGLWAIERYVVGKVPSTVKLNVKKPCSHCHTVK